MKRIYPLIRVSALVFFVSCLTVGSAQAGTQTKVFELSLGTGGTKACPIGTRIVRRAFGDLEEVRYHILPHGYKDSRDGSFQSVSYPCFAPTQALGRSPRSWVSVPPNQFQNVTIFWPSDSQPVLPKGVRSDQFNGLKTLRGYALNGSLVRIYIFTDGLPVQEQIIDTLTQKFGSPTLLKPVNIVTSGGKSISAKEGQWKTEEFHVGFSGVLEGERFEGNEFGTGAFAIYTLPAYEVDVRQREAEKGRINF